MCGPTVLGVKLVVHWATPVVAVGASVQLAGVKLPVSVKLTVPLGVLFVPVSVSLTVAVQVVGLLTGTVVGLQLTVVAVERLVTVTVVVPELAAWVVSPA